MCEEEKIFKQLFNEMKIDKCKASSSRGLTNQPLALGRVFVVVVAVVLAVAFLTCRSAFVMKRGRLLAKLIASLSICPPNKRIVKIQTLRTQYVKKENDS